jgi:hypothetical protein
VLTQLSIKRSGYSILQAERRDHVHKEQSRKNKSKEQKQKRSSQKCRKRMRQSNEVVLAKRQKTILYQPDQQFTVPTQMRLDVLQTIPDVKDLKRKELLPICQKIHLKYSGKGITVKVLKDRLDSLRQVQNDLSPEQQHWFSSRSARQLLVPPTQ